MLTTPSNIYKPVVKTVAVLSIVSGFLVITGWIADIEILKSIAKGLPSMKMNSAICFVLSGGVLLLLSQKQRPRHYFQTVLSSVIALTGLITLGQDITGLNAGIDEWLVSDRDVMLPAKAAPGRMAETTAFCFSLLGLSFLIIHSRSSIIKLTVQYALHLVTFVAFLAIIGYAYKIPSFYSLSFISSMAFPTSILLCMLSIAATFINPSLGITGMFTGKTTGSIMARRLFPIMVFLILIMGYLRLQLHWQNMVNEDFGIALFAISFVLLSLLMISVTAKYLDKIDNRRNKAEEELKAFIKKEHQQNLRKVMSALGDNIWEHDFASGKTIFSEAVYNLLGCSNNDAADNEKLWWNNTLPEDRHLLENNDKNYKSGTADHHILEYRILHRDGTVKWVLDRGVVIEKNSNGLPLKIAGTHTDITERKNAEAELSKIQTLFRSFMDHIPAMAWIVNKNSRFQFANRLYLDTFSETNSPLTGKSLFDLFPEETAMRYKKNEDAAFAAQRVLETIEPTIKKDGSNITVKVFRFPLKISETETLLGGIAIDVSDHIKTEETLRVLNEQLRVSNKELEQFAYIASHDLKEPLRMVSSFMQLLEKKYRQQLDDTAKQYIDFAVDGSERMKTLINDLLIFSRIGSEKKFDEKVDLNETLAEAKLNLMDMINECGAEISAPPLPRINGNKTQMVQLFQNLLGNAIKYRGEKKPEIKIGVSDNKNEFHFSVQDNGIGIEKKYFDKIFIIFQRLHNRSEYPGTGVGLSICKKITEKHGGVISVESDLGKGSTFHFTLAKKQKE
jgi:PAS domain S-box-containing protein